MGEILLTDEDAELLVRGLELLLKRVESEENFASKQALIQSLLESVQSLSDVERMTAIAAINKALGEIAAELESADHNTQL
ncbi:hypothetical protein NDI52_30460 [Leptolyngbya sp. PL-A3]|uniref:hypothetical protein n=1 Tax=Leptolyngbya sp. PL-A3 TaxID=2933911 RepID=UPI00329916D5